MSKALAKRAGFSDQMWRRLQSLRAAADAGAIEHGRALRRGAQSLTRAVANEMQGLREAPKGAKGAYLWTRVLDNPNPLIAAPANALGGKLVGLMAMAGVPDGKLSDLLYSKALGHSKRLGNSSAGKAVLKYYRRATATEPLKRLNAGVQRSAAQARLALARLKAKVQGHASARRDKEANLAGLPLAKQALNFNPLGLQLAKPKVQGFVSRLKSIKRLTPSIPPGRAM